MGRGLSPLQRWVLVEADKKKDYVDRWLHPAEVLAGFFRWQPKCELFDNSGAFVSWPLQKFQSSVIGEKRYRSDKASLSRAIDRLWSRGLIEVSRYGPNGGRTAIRITAAGKEAIG